MGFTRSITSHLDHFDLEIDYEYFWLKQLIPLLRDDLLLNCSLRHQ